MRSQSAVASGNPNKPMEPSFEKLLVLLADGGVRFVVVGGIAVAIQGYMRFTRGCGHPH